jgi:hypothetical protein
VLTSKPGILPCSIFSHSFLPDVLASQGNLHLAAAFLWILCLGICTKKKALETQKTTTPFVFN